VTGRRSNRAELRPRLNHPLWHFIASLATGLAAARGWSGSIGAGPR